MTLTITSFESFTVARTDDYKKDTVEFKKVTFDGGLENCTVYLTTVATV